MIGSVDFGKRTKKAFRAHFESNKVLAAAASAAVKALIGQARWIRGAAIKSIRNAKNGEVSKPRNPPFSHNGLLKRFLFFDHDKTAESVVVGPMLLSTPRYAGKTTLPIPRILEEGGTTYVYSPHRGGYLPRTIAPRPYMGPALERSKAHLSRFQQNALIK